MKKHHLIAVACFIAAVAAYASTAPAPFGVALLVIGAVFEGAGWRTLLRKSSAKRV